MATLEELRKWMRGGEVKALPDRAGWDKEKKTEEKPWEPQNPSPDGPKAILWATMRTFEIPEGGEVKAQVEINVRKHYSGYGMRIWDKVRKREVISHMINMSPGSINVMTCNAYIPPGTIEIQVALSLARELGRVGSIRVDAPMLREVKSRSGR